MAVRMTRTPLYAGIITDTGARRAPVMRAAAILDPVVTLYCDA
jgi:hypothetical protein